MGTEWSPGDQKGIGVETDRVPESRENGPWGDQGADLINMSLSFRPGYAPSIALKEALATAEASGVGMIVLAPGTSVDVDVRSQVAAHEFFHAVQYETGAYLAAPLAASWYREATADWAALEAFPDAID